MALTRRKKGVEAKEVDLYVGECEDCGEEAGLCLYEQRQICHKGKDSCRQKAIANRAELPAVSKARREFVVYVDGKAYRFKTKKRARAVCRKLLEVKRLPSDIAQQINDAWKIEK